MNRSVRFVNRFIEKNQLVHESDSTQYGVFLLNIFNFTVCITHENNLDKDEQMMPEFLQSFSQKLGQKWPLRAAFHRPNGHKINTGGGNSPAQTRSRSHWSRWFLSGRFRPINTERWRSILAECATAGKANIHPQSPSIKVCATGQTSLSN